MTAEQSSKIALHSLFDSLGIKRVVCIDDEFLPVSVEDITGLCFDAGIDFCKSVQELKGINFDAKERIWKNSLAKYWQEASYDTRSKLTCDFERQIGKDFTSISPLSQLLEFCEFQIKTPEEWSKEKAKLLKEADETPTLFLFDRDLGKAGLGSEGGDKLLADAINHGKAICGMLSHHFSLEEEQEKWLDFVNKGMPGDRFILISKKHLHDEKQLGFVRMVKLTILNSPCRELVKLLAERMREGIKAASESVSAINIFDFEDIVFKKSQGEGVWEADTLFRLLSLYQKKELRGDEGKNKPIHESVEKIRKVLNVQTHEKFSSKEKSWEIQRLEWYEEAKELNEHFLPLGLGDIFEKTNGQKRFMLLCQPCDLMIRLNGKRNYQLSDVFLVEITPNYNESTAYTKAKFFDPENGKGHFVNFQCRFAVSLDILDLCALNKSGEAVYVQNMDRNNLLIPASRSRATKLTVTYDKVIETLLNPPDQKKEQWLAKMPKATRDGGFIKPTFTSPNKIAYPIKRVGRLCSPFSDEILTAFCSYMARPAHAMEFAKDDLDAEDAISCSFEDE